MVPRPQFAMLGRTQRRRWFAGLGGAGVFLWVAVLMLLSPVHERQPQVAVSKFSEFTDLDGLTWRNFTLTNAGPGGVEYHPRGYQWTDLPMDLDYLEGAFIMGGSGLLQPGTADVLTWLKPSRQEGQWRFLLACRRSPSIVDRLRLRLHDRFPRFFGIPEFNDEPWLVTSPWASIRDEQPTGSDGGTARPDP
jgi:hypothetical protein